MQTRVRDKTSCAGRREGAKYSAIEQHQALAMAAHLRSLSSIARWRVLRWVLAIIVIPLVLWACTGHPMFAPAPMP
jgi:hypothetical protein